MDRSAFAGSVATSDVLVRNMINIAGCTLCEAVKMMTSVPANILKIGDKKGKIQKGYGKGRGKRRKDRDLRHGGAYLPRQ